MRIHLALGALALALALSPSLSNAQEQSRPSLTDMTDIEREAFRNEVRAYLLENPEVLMEAIRILEARRDANARDKDAMAIASNYQQIFKNPNSWVDGNPDGDITLVEFADYRCGYCKRAHPELKELLARDPNIRLVVKEFPILGPDSVTAARIATAATEIDSSKFKALNDAMMTFGGQLNETAIYQIAGTIGYDIPALKARAAEPDIEARIAETYALARNLGLEGTPSFVLGDQIIRGYIPLDEMIAAVAEARDATN
ncbi:MAG: DsbA family protein [Paracoccaceae bacterium]|nr:DsbA family protein [Paracoccaceae bacterium]